jgi:hypothetical protein
MPRVFQNIDPPPPGKCVPPSFGAGGEDTLALAVWRGGWGVNIFGMEDARQSSVLYICKNFVVHISEGNVSRIESIFRIRFRNRCHLYTEYPF